MGIAIIIVMLKCLKCEANAWDISFHTSLAYSRPDQQLSVVSFPIVKIPSVGLACMQMLQMCRSQTLTFTRLSHFDCAPLMS